MAGRVNAHLMVQRDGESWAIAPEFCPGQDEHRKEAVNLDADFAPECQRFTYGYGRRTCPYWYATTGVGNAAERLDGSTIHESAIAACKTQVRCGVLCLAARRNRPPGI